MKKKLLMLTATLLLAVSTQARIIEPANNQVWWGYFNESDFETNDNNIGTGKAMTLMAAIYIPAGHEQLGNATIDAVRVYIQSGIESSLSNLKIWISKELPNKYSEADFYQATLGTLNAGANDFKLSTPYEISGEEGIYVGYSVKSTTGYFIRCGGADAPNTFWIGNPDAGMDWTDLNGYGFGKLAFQLLISGGNFPSNCATAEDFGQNMVLQGQEVSIPITITNMGENAIQSIAYTISTEGGSTTVEKEVSLGTLTMNGSKTINIPFASDEETKKYQKTFTLTKVNGEPNTAKSNSATGFLITLKESQPLTPVIEEFTGTWCGWCPRGMVGMEKVHEQYGDQVVQIAAHYSDPMAINDYQSVINAFTTGFPNSITDRQFEADPSFSGLESALAKAFNRVAPASIALSAEWDSKEQKKVIFNTTTKFAYNDDNGQFGIAFILVEDGLKGTGSNWAQTNYYSGNGSDDMAWWGEQGSSVSGIEYNHVAVAGWSVQNGIDGSVAPKINANTAQKYSYTGSISGISLIQDKTKLKAVALLIDRTNGTIVNAAQCAIMDYETIITFADANVKALCIANWDTNKDGELSKAEAAAVTDLGTVFNGNQYITSFNELQFFTGLTSIGSNAFYNCHYLTSITIPNSVTSIGRYAFHYCSDLTSILIPNSVTSIGDYAFSYCRGLTSVTIPNSVTSIGDWAISYCSSLTSVSIPNSVTNIGKNAFKGCSGLKKVIVSDIAAWCNISFGGLSSNPLLYAHHLYSDESTEITDLVIPNSVTSIGNNAFEGCSGLTSATIGNSVTSIGDYAFSLCEGLASVAIPNSVTSIGDYAFTGCSSLTSVSIPNSVTSLGDNSFYGCSNLTDFYCYAENVPETGSDAFDKSPISSATLHVPASSIDKYKAASPWSGFGTIVGITPSNRIIDFADANVKALCVANWDTNGDGELDEAEAAAVTDLGTVFRENKVITSFNELQYFTGLTSIGEEAFYYCPSLTSVIIPSSVTDISDYAFAYCSGLTSVIIGNSVTSIGEDAFSGCRCLTSITIPNSVTSIGGYAFSNCHGLTSITIPKNVNSIGGGTIFWGCSSLTSIKVETGNKTYDSRNDCNAIIETATNKLIAGCKRTIIPSSVTIIGWCAFIASSLTSITIPNSVTNIESWAFRYCNSLTSVTIPKTVIKIGENPFGGCSGLASIKVETGNTTYDSRDNCNAIIETATNTLITGCKNTNIPYNVTSIGTNAFAYCDGLTSVSIPNSVTSIGRDAFDSCYDLTSITIPQNVTSIGSSAFGYCYNLTDVYCYAKNVPETSSNAFRESPIASATLYVPAGSVDAYRTTAPWSEFGTIVPLETDVFTAKTKEGVTMTFKILDEEEKTCQVGNGEEASVNVTTSGQVTIPEVANGYKVIAIGDKGFYNCSKLTHIWLHEGIERIGKLAFYGCTSLQVLDIPRSIIYIEDDAFEGCPDLVVNIPIEVIENLSYNPSPGTGVVISITHPSNPEQLNELERIYIPRVVTIIDERAFSNCKSVKVIEVDVENPVFDSRNDCNAIIRTEDNTLLFGCQNTIIPETVTAIASYAFEGHSNLKAINIPNGVTGIGIAAFSGCLALTDITSDIRKPFAISDDTFSDDTYRSATLTVPAGTKKLYQTTTGWKNFFNIVEKELQDGDEFMAHTVEGIEMTFKVISAKDKTCQVGNGIDASINEVTSGKVTIPEIANEFNVIAINDRSFIKCGSLTIVNIPNSVTSIGKYAFRYCNSLTSVNIPSGITIINTSAFEECSSLTSVFISDMAAWCNITFAISSSNPLYYAQHLYLNGQEITNLVIPEDVTSISDFVFFNCSSLTSVTVPNSVNSIGRYVFYGCSNLTSFNIGNGVTSIGRYAFSRCSSLSDFYCLAESVPETASDAFYNSPIASATLHVPAGSVEAYSTTAPWSGFGTIVTDSEVITMTGGYATFSCDQNLDFSGRYLRAYIASGFNKATNQVLLVRVYDVPAGTGVFLVGTPGDTYKIPYAETSSCYYLNLFQANLQESTVAATTGNYSNYTFGEQDGAPGFYPIVNKVTLQAQTAYLQLPSSFVSADVIEFVFEEDVIDGIENFRISESNDTIYDLAGRRLGKTQRGVNIVNGRKVVIK